MATDTVRVGRALLSVSDKGGLVDLARALAEGGVDLLSTGLRSCVNLWSQTALEHYALGPPTQDVYNGLEYSDVGLRAKLWSTGEWGAPQLHYDHRCSVLLCFHET